MNLLGLFFASAIAATPAPQPKALPAAGPDKVTQDVMALFSSRYKRLQHWKATFSQETFSVGLNRGSFGEGQFVFSAPDRFRYELKFPETSEYVSNGKEAWQVVYRNGRNKPAFVRHAKSLNSLQIESYLVFLRGLDAKGRRSADEVFRIKGSQQDGEWRLELSPRSPDSGVASVLVAFKTGAEVPDRFVVTDALGNTTTVKLKSFSRAQGPWPEAEFKPTIPRDSEVEETD